MRQRADWQSWPLPHPHCCSSRQPFKREGDSISRLFRHVRLLSFDRRPLLELAKTRVSQINGCAYYIDMQTKDARVLGESEQRFTPLTPGAKEGAS